MDEDQFRVAMFDAVFVALPRLEVLDHRLEKVEALLERIAASLETAKPRAKKKELTASSPGVRIWVGYRAEFLERYKVEPVRNAKTNALCAQLAQRLGEDAVPVAMFYVAKHNDRLYLNARHALDLVVRDAEKIHADWKRNFAGTSRDATNEESLGVARSQMERIQRGEL